jgi:basic membrane protein A
MSQANELCIVFDIGGRGDLSFNDMAALGGDEAAAAFGYTLVEQQSATEADYAPNFRVLSQGGNCVLIFGIGFLLGDALNEVSQEFPDQSYAIIDSVVEQPNVQSVLFEEHVGSALMGSLAASASQSGGVGIVLGIEIPVLWKFECGYKAGVRWVDNNFDDSVFSASPGDDMDKSTNIQSVYTGSFNDPALGQSAGEAQLAGGADILYQVAGLTGRGMITAVANAGRALGNESGFPFALGVDADQDYLEGGGFVLASMMKRVDKGVFQGAQSISEGTFSAGITVLGLESGGISISKLTDFDTFLQLGIDAGEIDAADRNDIFNRALALRTQFSAEFGVADGLAFLIRTGRVSVLQADSQDTIDACRGTYD